MPGRDDDDNDIENNENASPNTDAGPPPPPPPGPPPGAPSSKLKQTGAGARPFDANALAAKGAQLKKVGEIAKPKEQNSISDNLADNVNRYINRSANSDAEESSDQDESDNEWEDEEEEERLREADRRRIQAEIAQKKADAAKAEEIRAAERAAAQAAEQAEAPKVAPQAAPPSAQRPAQPKKKPMTLNERLAEIQKANREEHDDDWDAPPKEMEMDLDPEPTSPEPPPSSPLPVAKRTRAESTNVANVPPPPPPPGPPPVAKRVRTEPTNVANEPPPIPVRTKPAPGNIPPPSANIEAQLQEKASQLGELARQNKELSDRVKTQEDLFYKKINEYYNICGVAFQRVREDADFINKTPEFKPKLVEFSNEINLIHQQLKDALTELNHTNAAFTELDHEFYDLYKQYKAQTSKEVAKYLIDQLGNQYQLNDIDSNAFREHEILPAVDLRSLAQNAAAGITEIPRVSGAHAPITEHDFDAIFVPPMPRDVPPPQNEQQPEPEIVDMELESPEPDLGPAPTRPPRKQKNVAQQPEQQHEHQAEQQSEHMETESPEPDLGPAPTRPPRKQKNVAQQPEQQPVQQPEVPSRQSTPQPAASQPRMSTAEESLPPPTFEPPPARSIGFAYRQPITPKHDQGRLSNTAPSGGGLAPVTSTLGGSLASLTAYLAVDSNRKSCDVKKYEACNLPWDNNRFGLEISMKNASTVPNKVYAYESNEKGLTFAVNKQLPENDSVATIRNVCKMAVGSAKPDAVFDLTKTHDNKKDLVFEHLNNAIEALKAKAQAQGKDLSTMKFPTITGYTPSHRPPGLSR